jgi:hypothetical protein
MKKPLYRTLAIFFGILSFGGFSEAKRIFTSDAPDIAAQRPWLMVMSVSMVAIMVFLAVFFWRKSTKLNG